NEQRLLEAAVKPFQIGSDVGLAGARHGQQVHRAVDSHAGKRARLTPQGRILFCSQESRELRMKTPPTYAVTSVDNALRIATMLQLEGPLTVAEVADRLAVARSTAHRLLQLLVYRDFPVQDRHRAYRAGRVLELSTHSSSRTAQLRAISLPHLETLVDRLQESANLSIRI